MSFDDWCRAISAAYPRGWERHFGHCPTCRKRRNYERHRRWPEAYQ